MADFPLPAAANIGMRVAIEPKYASCLAQAYLFPFRNMSIFEV
jgi:hypothetical protein